MFTQTYHRTSRYLSSCCTRSVGNIRRPAQITQQQLHHHRFYYTNADRVKSEDPYAMLGLSYGDGADLETIRTAFRKKAVQLHPDVNRNDPLASKQFQALIRAYEILTKPFQTNNNNTSIDLDEWRIRIWRNGDRIAISRTDVAGIKKVRPIQPVGIRNQRQYQIGHPNHSNDSSFRRNEYIADGKQSSSSPVSSSVGRGQNKWVPPKPYTPWKNQDT
jgi:hypothetical protein